MGLQAVGVSTFIRNGLPVRLMMVVLAALSQCQAQDADANRWQDELAGTLLRLAHRGDALFFEALQVWANEPPVMRLERPSRIGGILKFGIDV
jgi:hypothetical protein